MGIGARHDRVHADVVGRELDGALPREGRDGALDRGVHTGGREAVQRGWRGHVDDDAATLRAHLRQGRLRRPEARLQSHGEHPVDRLLVDLLDVLVADPHRAVDDDVDPIQRAERRVHRGAVGHVEREIRTGRPVDADHLHAVGGQALGDPGADPAPGAGHDGDAAHRIAPRNSETSVTASKSSWVIGALRRVPGEALRHRLQQRPDLHAGQVLAQAAVGAVAEHERRGRLAVQPERVGLLEPAGVALARAHRDEDRAALLHVEAVELEVVGGDAEDRAEPRPQPDDLLDRRADERPVRHDLRPARRVLQQRPERQADLVDGVVDARLQQPDARLDDLGLGEVARLLLADERGREVVAQVAAAAVDVRADEVLALDERVERLLPAGGVHRQDRAERAVGEPRGARGLLRRGGEQLAVHERRDAPGDVAHEVDVIAVRRLVEDPVDDRPHAVLQLGHLALSEQSADRQPQMRARLAVVRDQHAVPRLADRTLGDAERVEAVEERPALLEPPVAQERHALRVAQHLVAALAAGGPAALARLAQLGERRAAGIDLGEHVRAHAANPREAATRSEAFSPIITVGAAVLPDGITGMIDASATRSPSTPRTRSSGSTTASSPVPIRQVPTGCAYDSALARM